MIFLVATTETLEMETSAAVSTDWTVSYVDITTSTFVPGASQGNVASATSTTLVSAPASSTQRQIKQISVRNRDASASQTVILKKDISGTEYHITGTVTLLSGEMLLFVDGVGFVVYDATGKAKLNTTSVGNKSSVLMVPHFSTADLTSTKAVISTNTNAVYVGKAPKAFTSAQIRFRVTTAAAVITWAEVALAKGSINLGGNPSLTVVGYANVAAVINGTGLKSVTVSLDAGQVVNEGDDLWALIGNQATTAVVLRAQSIADDIQVGTQANLATRPSLNVGSSEAYTVESTTVLAAWLAVLV